MNVTTPEVTRGTAWVGQPLPRREDLRLVRGQGSYIGDINRPKMLHLRFVRSAQAHARIVSVDLSAALKVPGVVAGFTGHDLVGCGMRNILIPSLVPDVPGELRVPPSLPLAVDRVVFHGEPLAVLVGADRYTLEDAAELVRVEYESLPVVVDPERALEADSPRVYEWWPDNVLYRQTMGNDASEAFAEADVVIEERLSVPRTGCSPMEPRGALAEWTDDEGLRLWSTTQRPHLLSAAIAEVLEIPEHRVRVIAPHDQGGSFGTKAPLAREDFVISLVAKTLKRPVRWIETREESFRAGVGQERGQIHYMQMAAKRDGTILGVRDRCIADAGDGNQPMFMGFGYARSGCFWMSGVYDIPQVEIELLGVATNKPSLTPSRSFGQLPGRFAMDRMVDMLAKELGLDPVEVRRKNLVREFPHVTATGNFLDSGDYVGGLDKAVETIDLEAVRREQDELRKQGRYIGVGFGCETEMSGVTSAGYTPRTGQPGYGVATIKITGTGKVVVSHGDAPSGQGHETTIAQVLADEFGVTPDDVTLKYGDTWTTPYSIGTVGNRMGSSTVSAAVLAARELRKKMATVAAHDLGVDAEPEEFSFVGGNIVWDGDPDQSIAFSDVARHLVRMPLNLPPGVEAGLEQTSYYEPPDGVPTMYGSSFHAAVVEVNPESGEFTVLRYIVIDDCGRAINPLVVEGINQGGVVMGIGNAIFEEFVYDDRGVLQNTTLEGYLMPSAADVPDIEIHEHSVPTPYTPLGTKGKGEGAPGPVPGTLANAIIDALAPLDLDIKLTALPLRPERIWRAIEAAREAVRAETVEQSQTMVAAVPTAARDAVIEPAPATSADGEIHGEALELLEELRRLCDTPNTLPAAQPSWHPYMDEIAAYWNDFEYAVERATASPRAVELLATLIEGEAELGFVEEAAPPELIEAWRRTEALPHPDDPDCAPASGQHAYLDDILPALEAHRLLLIALSHTAAESA